VQHWHWAGKLHHLRLAQAELLWVPFGSFEVEARDEGTVLGVLSDLVWLLWHWDEIEFQLVDWGTAGFTAEPLEKGGGETSWVGECSSPEVEWDALLRPDCEELVSVAQVVRPVGEWLEREVGKRPSSWYFVLTESDQDLLELWRDDHQTLDSLFELLQADAERPQQNIISLNLLNEDDVEWILVASQLVLQSKDIESLWQALFEVLDQLQLTTVSSCGT